MKFVVLVIWTLTYASIFHWVKSGMLELEDETLVQTLLGFIIAAVMAFFFSAFPFALVLGIIVGIVTLLGLD